jgi:hypothetical protein
MKARGNTPVRTVKKTGIAHEQFKCRSCEKRQYCYGSRYCQNEFNPVSLVAPPPKKKQRPR